jgi:predicted lipid-binding transport protein (Tim44 family)
MRRFRVSILAIPLALSVMLGAIPADARVNSGLSLGSRGTHTFSAPPGTASSPYGAAPIQRSLTPQGGSTYAGSSFSNYGYGHSYGMRPGSAFTSGLMGGLLGAGIGGLLFGGGFFHGMHGGSGVLGLLLQLFLLYMLARWAFRRFAGGLSMAGAGMYGRMLYPGAVPAAARPGLFGGGRKGRPISLDSSDFRSFTEVLRHVQAAWTAHDITALRTLATPEMVGYFAEQLAEQASRGVRNQVTDVRLEKGDLSEAWTEGTRDYATVSMTFSMIDATLDSVGRVLDGSLTERVTATEFWTFLRAPRSNWILSAIQQTS